jgi:hypothetical protein
MSRVVGMVCAGALLLGAAGCFLGDAFLASPVAAARYRCEVADKYASVAADVEQALNEAGVSVLTKRLDGEIRLAGQSKDGKVFCLYVKRKKTEAGETSMISVKWDRAPDEELWRVVTSLRNRPERSERQPDTNEP